MSSVTSDMFEIDMDMASSTTVPNLGHSILNKPAKQTGNEALMSPEDQLRILREAADRLEESGQISNVAIKQEPADDQDDDVICLGESIIDLTHFPENKTVIIPDDDGEELFIIGAKADKLPRPKKRNANEMAHSDNEPEQTARKKSKKSKAKGRGNKIDLANAPSVQKLMTTSLFSEIANLEDVPNMPDFDEQAIRRGNSDQLFAHLDDSVNQVEAIRDARMLNRACNIFGRGHISRADNGEWLVKGMESTLKNHQVLGTAFMISKEREARDNKSPVPQGGILADQMGLGKTVMALGLCTRGKARDFDRQSIGLGSKTTLVIATPSLVNQWYEEIGTHCNTNDTRSGIGTYTIYRSREWRDRHHPIRELAKNDIIVTTYEEVAKSFPFEDPPEELTDQDERQKWWDDYFQKNKGHLHRMNFRRVIIDEAHLIRNPDTIKSRAVRVLVGKYRWCLTGTPFTNGVQDIWSLLDFIDAPGLESYDTFKAKYLKANEQVTANLNAILGKCMLRRSHADRLFGAKLVSLPKASQMQLVCHFNPVEREIYNIIEAAFRRRMQEAMKTHGLMFSRNNSYFAMLTRLRQLTAHPLLIQSTMLDLLERKDIRKLRVAIDEHGVVLQDKKEGKALMTKIKLILRASYKTKKRTRKNAVDSAAPAPQTATANSSGGAPQEENLGSRYGQRTNFNHMWEHLRADHDILTRAALGRCEYCKKEATTPQITECCHIYCQQCLIDLQLEAASEGLDRAVCAVVKCKAQYNFVVPFDNEEFSKLVTLKKTVRKTSGGRIKKTDLPAGIVSWMDKGDLVPSAKTKAVKTQIVEWFEQFPNSKIIIYTQWTTMIKILANMCDIEEWKCVRFFGAMTPEARTRAINRFETEDDLKIMICSLQCGGLGLNLTAASKVIVVDAWWNNAVEEQAFARCYRIKQTQETHLLQLSVFNTIDDRIAEVKDRKQLQIDAFSNEKTLRQLSQREIMSLFGEVFEDDDGNMRYLMEGEEDEGESDEEDDRIMEVDEEVDKAGEVEGQAM